MKNKKTCGECRYYLPYREMDEDFEDENGGYCDLFYIEANKDNSCKTFGLREDCWKPKEGK